MTFQKFRNEACNDEDAFRKLLAEMERLSCLAHGNDQSYASLCDVLWKAVEGQPWALHAQTKTGIEFVFDRAVEGLYESIHKYNAKKDKNRSSAHIVYGNNDLDSNQDEPHDEICNYK